MYSVDKLIQVLLQAYAPDYSQEGIDLVENALRERIAELLKVDGAQEVLVALATDTGSSLAEHSAAAITSALSVTYVARLLALLYKCQELEEKVRQLQELGTR